MSTRCHDDIHSPNVPARIDSRSNTFFKSLRAVAITGVIFRHVNDHADMLHSGFWSLHFFLLTHFLWGSFTVSLFIFLAGYFGTASYKKSSTLVFWKKRFTRLGTPYLIWTTIYLLLNVLFLHLTYSCKDLVLVFLLGSVHIPFYFFIVLFQLVLLTPLLFAWATNRKLIWLPYMISFLYVMGCGYIYIRNETPFWQGVMHITPFIPWLAVYSSGMLCNLYETAIHEWLFQRIKLLTLLTIVSYLFFFGCIMYLFHVQDIQTTLAFRNLTVFTFIPINLLLFVLFFYRHTVIQNRLMLLVGSYSYGIFLIHLLFIGIIERIPFFQMLAEFPVPYSIIATAAILGCSVGTIWLDRKMLGEKKAAWFGF